MSPMEGENDGFDSLGEYASSNFNFNVMIISSHHIQGID
jgi:hypothetical protein